MTRIFKTAALVFTVLACLFTASFPVYALDAGLSGNNANGSYMLNNADWTEVTTSYLVPTDNGWMAVEALQDTSSYKLRILYYDSSYSLNETKTINGELPFFGTFCTDGSYYYVISGQDNPAEDDNVECYRVTKYDKSWKKSKSCAITNCYTARPFYIGGCAAAFSGNVLMVHTGHESYTYSDGLKHQTNLTFTVNTAEMQRMASIHQISNTEKGYVSHSFNQFVAADGNYMVTLDHGDAYPRAAYLYRYERPVTDSTFPGAKYGQGVNMIKFAGVAGKDANRVTNAGVGGLAVSSTHYLAAGNASDQSKEGNITRNIWVSAVTKDLSSVSSRYLTSSQEGGTSYSVPKLVPVGNDRFLIVYEAVRRNLSWHNNAKVYYGLLNNKGVLSGGITSTDGLLSDCQPVVKNNKAVWYVYEDKYLTFYEIDLSSMKMTAHQAVSTDWVTPQGIAFDKSELHMTLNEIVNLGYTISPGNASDTRTYATVDDTSVCTYASGKVRPVSEGTTTVRIITPNGKSSTCTVHVLPKLEKVTYNRLTSPVSVGDSQEWNLRTVPESLQPYVRYESLNPDIVSVSATGTVTALANGTAKLTCTIGETHVYTAEITVGGVVVDSISLDAGLIQLSPNETRTLTVTFSPANASDRRITWSSSDDRVARVDQNGRVTAVGQGDCIITATSSSGKKAECTVRVSQTDPAACRVFGFC
ncbi:MAG: Ig-like domain-containing protein, partial [Solobacterium sp.]|nr:Ig-like domain-containing protein [Solobacterium sp.]